MAHLWPSVDTDMLLEPRPMRLSTATTRADVAVQVCEAFHPLTPTVAICLRYDTIGEFNMDSKVGYSALSSTRSQKKKLKQTTTVQSSYKASCARPG